MRSRHHFLHRRGPTRYGEVDRVSPEDRVVHLDGGGTLGYDYLVVATRHVPARTRRPGCSATEWRRSIFDFYSLDGACALATALATFDRGRLVVHITEMPIKCPVAPLEFTFLAEA